MLPAEEKKRAHADEDATNENISKLQRQASQHGEVRLACRPCNAHTSRRSRALGAFSCRAATTTTCLGPTRRRDWRPR
jgi:hypothetical protein